MYFFEKYCAEPITTNSHVSHTIAEPTLCNSGTMIMFAIIATTAPNAELINTALSYFNDVKI